MIKKGCVVSLDYTLIIDEKIIGDSKGKEPLCYTHGEGQIIPGLANRLEGMREGEEKKIVVPAEEAYGLVDTTAFQEVKRTMLPQGIEPKAGKALRVRNAEGKVGIVKIMEVNPETVVVDFNHPFAGKTLVFEVKILSVQ
ncbi:MAG: peptidylprolyl isomerase [Candidatus Omnitrophica bacterium]|nr:peptidylprolyl isomerase [Candidatus Omnitrophota bacterium]MBU4479229.1 peptidylprolyl isomerase [Candidatus Omnitrophota bacterium]MCG2703919.1 peptidylprolyl isomerase [Candidatus Omnitrophota bacterium]